MSEAKGRAAVHERSQGRCEVCGRASATDWMHRLPRSAGGTWSPANGLDGCRPCHERIELHLDPFTGDWADVFLHGWKIARGLTVDPATIATRLLHPVYGPGWWLPQADGLLVWVAPWEGYLRAYEQLPTRKSKVIR